MDGGPLRCPSCEREHPPSERFCERCGMPLVSATASEEPAVSERRETARKIKPEYAEGKLVKVARGGSQPEAEFIAGLLLEEGIPSMLRRSGGADVPDFMAAGPRDIMVPESGAQAAREALAFKDDAP
jgi:Putative prokaryotic signal transducing protein/zinc-ribbon domain